MNPLPRQRRRHVPVVVVVAENREDAVRRVQRRQQLGDRPDERAIAEASRSRRRARSGRAFERQRELHGRADVVGADQRAVMDVGEQRDAQAVERGRQPGDRQRAPAVTPMRWRS